MMPNKKVEIAMIALLKRFHFAKYRKRVMCNVKCVDRINCMSIGFAQC